MDVTMALAELEGAARTRQLLEKGCTPFDIRSAVANGTVRRVSKGVIAAHDAHPDTVRAVVLGAGITCVSALERHDLPLRRLPDLLHLAVPYNFSAGTRSVESACLHYQRARPSPGHVLPVAEALDCAGACLDPVWHLVALDAALQRGLVTLGDVLGFRRTSRERREFLLRFADARAEAPGETVARLQLAQAGFAVRPQAYIDGAGRVDIEVESLLIVQVDGYGPHSSRPAFKRDRERSRAVIKAGRPQLTYAASELLGTYTADVARDVRQALEQWNSRDPARIVPSGPRALRIRKEASAFDPSGS